MLNSLEMQIFPKARGLELPSPGINYDNAFKVVYAAAVCKLNMDPVLLENLQIDGVVAVKQLNYLGYKVLNLDEFLNFVYHAPGSC